MIYFDNAATSYPKPDCVTAAMTRFMTEIGANPGRSGHRLANEAERLRLDAREAMAELLGVSDPMRVIFTHNGTAALNLAIHGLLSPAGHAVATGMEHNAVMRPLRALEQSGVEVSIAECAADGVLDPAEIERRLRPDTRLIIATHASNVCGTVLPVGEVAAIARRHGIPLLVDAAQTAGVWPIDMAADGIDLLAFTGHKGLLGPTGTGGLAFGADFDIDRLRPLVQGGTGSRSEHEWQPDFLPDKYEAGTANIVGLAGLAAGVRYVLDQGVETLREHCQELTAYLIGGLRRITGVRVYGTAEAQRQTAVVSFAVAGCSSAEVARRLDEDFWIMCRPGLHCAPRAHRTLGTFPEGTVRFSLGSASIAGEVEEALAAVSSLARVESDG
jgi:cysteine desulfurase/selenocysteine lyase